MKKKPQDEILTIEELASFLETDQGTVCRLFDKGILPAPIGCGAKFGWHRSTVEWMQPLNWSKIEMIWQEDKLEELPNYGK